MGALAGDVAHPGQWKLFAQLLLEDHCTRTTAVDVKLLHASSPHVQAEPASPPGLIRVAYGGAPRVAQSWWWLGAGAAWGWGWIDVSCPAPRRCPLHASELFTGTSVSFCLMLAVIS